MKRNGKIEFLRFIFALIIVIHHSRYLLGDKVSLFLGGSLGVEFFFIVSGFLFARSVDKINAGSSFEDGRIGKETESFLIKKVNGLYVEFLVSCVISLLFLMLFVNHSLFKTIELAAKGVFELLLVHMSGLGQSTMNSVIWYFSTMLISMAVLYPLLRKHYDYSVSVAAPLSALLILGFLCMNYSDPRNPSKWIGWTFKGNLRGFAEICLGIWMFRLHKMFESVRFNKAGRLFLEIIEDCGYIAAVYYMYKYKASNNDYIVILILWISIGLTFIKQSLFSELFDKKVFYSLGRYSVCLYLSHITFSRYLSSLIPGKGYPEMLLIYLLISFVNAAVIMFTARWIRDKKPFSRFLGIITEKAE